MIIVVVYFLHTGNDEEDRKLFSGIGRALLNKELLWKKPSLSSD